MRRLRLKNSNKRNKKKKPPKVKVLTGKARKERLKDIAERRAKKATEGDCNCKRSKSKKK